MSAFVWTGERVATVLGLLPGDYPLREYSGVSTDTRSLAPGHLFVALRGDTHDGADFVPDAVAAGGAGAVIERRVKGLPADFDQYVVADSLTALGKLASARRRALAPTVVAVTGTSGKTTTRRLIATALGPGAAESPGNFNNLVGVPLSMLRAGDTANLWVLELASNRRGEIEQLGRMVEPDIGVITSIGEGHLEGLGDVGGVLEEKLAMLGTIKAAGSVFVADQPPELVAGARDRFSDVTSVGVSDAADECPTMWSASDDGVVWTWKGVEFTLPGFGVHLVRNGMLAASVAERLGVAPRVAAERWRDFALPPLRGELRRVGGLTLLVDCYNANPSSFEAAIDSLAGQVGRRRAVLAGTMLELGERSAELHARVARRIVEVGIELIVATGEFTQAFAAQAAELGDRLVSEEDVDTAYALMVERLQGDEVVLLKASRGVKLERVIPRFERDFGRSGRFQTCGNGA